MKNIWVALIFGGFVFMTTHGAFAACSWEVSGEIQDKAGRPLTNVKVKLKAKWTGKFPYNDPNWPDVVTDSRGRFTAKTIRFPDCRRRRDVTVSVHDGRRWRQIKKAKRQRGPKVRFGKVKASFLNLPRVTSAPGGTLRCQEGSSEAHEALCGSDVGGCKGQFTVGDKLKMSYYRTHALGAGHSSATRAVIIMHGNGRTADGYFAAAYAGVKACNALDQTVILAPDVYAVYPPSDNPDMAKPDQPKKGQIYWDGNSSWKFGGDSSPGRSPRLSSFDVIDHMIGRLANRKKFPKLKVVVIAGHSAGGMLVQRYALGTRVDERHRHLSFRFIVANPSSYAYLNEMRLKTDRHVRWGVTGVPGANAYPYGLDLRNRYLSKDKAKLMRKRYVRRKVVYFVGTEDVESRWLDQSPAAGAQGSNRWERAFNFMYFMNRFYPKHKHRYFTTESHHSSGKMFRSPEGGYLLSHY